MNRRDLLPVFLLLLALGLAVLDRVEQVPSPRSWVANITTSAQATATRLFRNLSNASVFFENLDVLRAENEMLRHRVEELTVELVALQEVLAENEVLRRELGFAQKQRALGLVGADVETHFVGTDPGNLVRAITIRINPEAGLLPDMPVITGRGLVGRITEINGSSASVILLTDPNSAVASIVQRTRATGLVKGQLDGSVVMEGIERDADIEVGDIVLTSGLGDVFPRAIVIGQVSEVIRTDTAMFQKAVISPSVNFTELDLVLVVTNPQAEYQAQVNDE